MTKRSTKIIIFEKLDIVIGSFAWKMTQTINYVKKKADNYFLPVI